MRRMERAGQLWVRDRRSIRNHGRASADEFGEETPDAEREREASIMIDSQQSSSGEAPALNDSIENARATSPGQPRGDEAEPNDMMQVEADTSANEDMGKKSVEAKSETYADIMKQQRCQLALRRLSLRRSLIFRLLCSKSTITRLTGTDRALTHLTGSHPIHLPPQLPHRCQRRVRSLKKSAIANRQSSTISFRPRLSPSPRSNLNSSPTSALKSVQCSLK